jgi:DNA damage-binding protein 1
MSHSGLWMESLFLDLDEDVQSKAVVGLGVDVESVRGLVEGLRRLH